MAAIDHVIFVARDLSAAAHRFWQEHGLASYDGGRHPEYGTANRIIPLGSSYIEIMGIADEAAAQANPLGQTVLAATEAGERWLLACVRPADIDATAARIGSVVVPGHRTRPDGRTVSWRLAGLEIALDEHLPFFIAWTDLEATPGRETLEHRLPYRSIDRVVLGGNSARIDEHLSVDKPTGVTVGIGEAGVQSVSLSIEGGDSVAIR